MKCDSLSSLSPLPLLALTSSSHHHKSPPFHNPSKFKPYSSSFPSSLFHSLSFRFFKIRPAPFRPKIRCSNSSIDDQGAQYVEPQGELGVEVRNPAVLSNLPPPNLSSSDRAFFLLAFIACTTSVAFVGFVAAAVPTLFAMGRAAISLAKLADTAREELPSTMAAIRLSGMEISDLTLELSDLSREIADGVNKSAQAVQAADTGIRQLGSLARQQTQQTMSLIQERAPDISLQPVVVGAAKKTSRAVGRATRMLMNMISRGEISSPENEEANALDRLEF